MTAPFPPGLLVQIGLALGLFILTAWLPPLQLFSDQGHHLLLHLTLEFLSTTTALMIFTVGWFAFGHERGARYQVLACAFLAVALLDLIHVLSYAGMPDLVTPSGLEQAITFWLPARATSALAVLVAAALASNTSLNRWQRGWLLAATLAVAGAGATLGLYYPDTAPRTFIPGQGLARFTVAVEYAVMTLYGVAVFLLIRGWRRERDRFRALLIAGVGVLLIGELSLTLYATVADLLHLLGHLCKTWGDGLIFWAVYTQALDEPHRRLRQSQGQLASHEQQAQALLRENQALLDNAFVAILFVRERRFIRANRCAEALFGYAPGALNGLSTAVIYPDQAAYLALGEHAYPVIERGELFTDEVELIRKDGSRFCCLMRAQALALGEPLDGIIWILEDATERHRAAAAIQASLDFQKELLEAIPTPVFYKDTQGRYQNVNHAFIELFGGTAAELVGHTVYDAWPRETADIFFARDQALFQNPGLQVYETQVLNRRGERRDVVFHKATLHAPDGTLRGLIGFILDITERKVAETALQRSEARFRTLFSAAKAIMLLIDPATGAIVDANTAAADYYGFAVEELRRMDIGAINILSAEEIAAQMRRAAGDQRWRLHFRHRLADGAVRDVEIHSGPLELDRRPLLYSIIHDITDQKAAEDALRASEERHRSALAALAEGVVVYDRHGALVAANPAAERILGLATDEFHARPVDAQDWRIIRGDGSPFPPEEWPSVVTLSTGIPQRDALMGVFRPNGQLTWLEVNAEPIRDPLTGTSQAAVVSFNDITARKAAEDALRASEERLQLVLDGSNDGFWDWNITTGEVLFSRHWAQLLGYDLAEVEPHIRGWKRLMHPDDRAHSRAALQAHFAGNTAQYQVEHRLRTKGGEWRWFLHRGKVTARDGRGRPLRMAGTHTDITERRLMEEALHVSLVTAERHDAWMVALNRMNELLLSCETRAEAYAIIARGAGRLFPGASGALAVLGEDTASELRVVASWGDPGALPTTFPLDHCWALRRGEVHEVMEPARSVLCRHLSDPLPPPHLCIPLMVRGETLGLLHISARETLTAAPFGDLRTLAVAVSESVKLTLSNLRLQETLREQAIRDPLTGLFNRRYLDEALPREVQRSRRRGEPLAVAMLDLDHFKRFNDAYGHEAGDAVLRAVGTLLAGALRAGDLACRYGGEELTLILPGADLDAARAHLDGLRQAIMQTRVLHQGGDLPTITVSIGVTVAGDHDPDAAALLARADAALYRAKEAGRNRVIAAAA